MRSLVSFLVLLLVAAVQAISSSGNRLLVILEDVADKANYSKFLGDLEGMHMRGSCWVQIQAASANSPCQQDVALTSPTKPQRART
jgi:hypothetical protein